MKRLQGIRTLITGGTSGIGLETARQFVAEGAQVAVTGTGDAGIAAAREEFGPDTLVIKSDAGDVAAQAKLAKTVGLAFGALDAVFVNAGFAPFSPVDQLTEEVFDKAIAVNLKGPFFLIQALLPILANPSSIVLNTSINATLGMPNTSLYAASKAGLSSLIRTLSGELVGRGIRVNAVSPGPVATPLYGKLGLPEDDVKAAVLSQIPLGRFGEPREIAKAVVFLASKESAYTLGSELVIDGGMSTL